MLELFMKIHSRFCFFFPLTFYIIKKKNSLTWYFFLTNNPRKHVMSCFTDKFLLNRDKQ